MCVRGRDMRLLNSESRQDKGSLGPLPRQASRGQQCFFGRREGRCRREGKSREVGSDPGGSQKEGGERFGGGW